MSDGLSDDAKQKPMRFLRRPEVQARVGLSHTQIDNLEHGGRFPKRIKISEKATGWLESEVEAFIQQRVAESRRDSTAAA